MEKQKESKPEKDTTLNECGYWSHFFERWSGKDWAGDFFELGSDVEKLPAKKEK